jgi:hypothetical protein
VSAAAQTDDQMLEEVQRETFDYFLHEVNSANGLVSDSTQPGWPCSITATGFALAAYPIGVERGLCSRDEALQRTLKTLHFFADSTQSEAPDATGYKGFYYHFLDMTSGRRTWNSELSTIDTTFLVAGMLAAAAYFDGDSHAERSVRTLAEQMYRRIDWRWAQNGGPTVTMGWRPDSGFLPHRWEGYNEALLLYLLALGAPTFAVSPDAYSSWLSSYVWKSVYGQEYVYAGPLFIHQLSHMWVDFRGIQDGYMRKRGIDYFENSRRATYVQQMYAMENPLNFAGYGKHCWGITASNGPGPETLKIHGVDRQFFGYLARGAPFGPDDGTLSPWAVAASLPFAPEIVLPTLRSFIDHVELKPHDNYGFDASFNAEYPARAQNKHGWVSPWKYGLNEGPIVLMIENYRSEFLWRLMRNGPITNGLKRAGFTGGCL